jgi:hypothetical protein
MTISLSVHVYTIYEIWYQQYAAGDQLNTSMADV